MQLHAIMPCSLVNGPGRRTVVWFQGCELHCAGCWNKSTHSRYAGVPVTLSELVSRILEARHQYRIEGVTFSGGEPIHQIESLTESLSILRKAAPELSVGLFSGYTKRELEQGQFETYAESTRESRKAAGRNFAGCSTLACSGVITNTSHARIL